MTRNCPCCQSLTCPASETVAHLRHDCAVLHQRLHEALVLLELWHLRVANAELTPLTEAFLGDDQQRSLHDSPPSQG